jgi:hypothetical protein
MDLNPKETLSLIDMAFQITKAQAEADFELKILDNVSIIDKTIENFKKLKEALQ